MNKNILFTDIVGYSKLTGDDQSLALELLNEHDKIIEPIISRYKGQIIKRIGDAIVAIFNNTEQMIQTSIEIQQSLKNRNIRNTKARHIVLRIGLHYGNVTIKGNEIYGAGYDLGSEIEPIAEYGGIAISESVYSNSNEDNELIVKGVNNHFFIQPIAKFNFKSNSTPILIYKLYLNLLDWYDQLYSDSSKYLLNQHVSSNRYNITDLIKYNAIDLKDHLTKANTFLDNHNLSYAIYHYKMYLDYSKKSNIDIELLILKVFSECGLVRLVDSAFKKNKFNLDLAILIKGINFFNHKKWDEASIKFDAFLQNSKNLYIFDALYYLLIILFNQKKYNDIIKVIDSKSHLIESSILHSSIISIIQKIVLLTLDQNKHKHYDDIIKLYNSFDKYFCSINILNKKKYSLFLYYFVIQFYYKFDSIEKAINIQNIATSLIKECQSSITGFLLRQLFFKNPILHQIIMEPLEFELIDNEGLDDIYDLDDILSDQQEVNKFCISCGIKNNIKFKFCTSCGKKLIN